MKRKFKTEYEINQKEVPVSKDDKKTILNNDLKFEFMVPGI
jgi:hypothetical protein